MGERVRGIERNRKRVKERETEETKRGTEERKRGTEERKRETEETKRVREKKVTERVNGRKSESD
jgi:hypothetical protein